MGAMDVRGWSGSTNRWGETLVCAALVLCCGCRENTDARISDERDARPPVLVQDPESIVVHDLFSMVHECDVYHRGAVIDLGEGTDSGQQGYDLFGAANGFSFQGPWGPWTTSPATLPGVAAAGANPSLEVLRSPRGSELVGQRQVVREGSGWMQVLSKSFTVSFYQLKDEPVFVEARIRGMGSRHATVWIDGKVVGALRFQRKQSQIVSTRTTTTPLASGNHVLSIGFSGAKQGEPKAEIDWVRIGIPDNDPTTFGAPTYRNLATQTTIGDKPTQALAMRGPGRVRCALPISPEMRLQAMVGYSGVGEGTSHIELVKADGTTTVLHTANLASGEKTAEPVDVSFEGLGHQHAAIDLVAASTSAGGRILFGTPVLVVRNPKVTEAPQAQVIVVVVLSGANPSQVPPYATTDKMGTMSSLVAESVTFFQHRAPTTVSAGSVASLLTGLSASQHFVTDLMSKLPAALDTIATVARDGRVTTAMFTANPATFEPFGMNRGWDRFVTVSPVSGQEAIEPLRQATQWMDEQLAKDSKRRLLVVVHARGGHPPWVTTNVRHEDLAPKDYSGNLNSRRGGQILAAERNRRFGRRPMPADDRVRAQAFAEISLSAEDKLLGEMIERLRHRKVWPSTLLVITSDIAMGGPDRVPFGDGEELGEDILDIPLMIRFPQDRLRGVRVQAPTTAMDLSRTILRALDLEPTTRMQGRDLMQLAAFPGRFTQPPQYAFVRDSYATRSNTMLLMSKSPRKPWLCSLDATMFRCAEDQSANHPLMALWLWKSTYRAVQSSAAFAGATGRDMAPEVATLDADTVAALTVWGSLEPAPTKP